MILPKRKSNRFLRSLFRCNAMTTITKKTPKQIFTTTKVEIGVIQSSDDRPIIRGVLSLTFAPLRFSDRQRFIFETRLHTRPVIRWTCRSKSTPRRLKVKTITARAADDSERTVNPHSHQNHWPRFEKIKKNKI